MSPEEFRSTAHQLVDWIADYRNDIKNKPVRAQVKPGDIRNAFPDFAPEQPEDFSSVIKDLNEIVVPGVTQVQHPMHYGWFPSNASLASVLGDFACAGMGTLGISWESCPSLTEVEEVVCEWLRKLTGLSDQWEGTIHDTASTACITALMIARERTSNFSENAGGLQAEKMPLVIYTTSESHSSVRKAALLAGFGADNVCNIAIDPVSRKMSAHALKEQIEQDISRNRIPCCVVATAGSTGVTAFDPINDIADILQGTNIWLHVDAAMAGSAMLLPECRHLWHGVERSDSLSWNPHKWMGTILDCSMFYVRDPQHLIRVMSTNPSYLRSTVDGEVTQYRDWGIPLGRRFRALKLWFHLRLDGVESIRTRIRRDLANAQWLSNEINAEDEWHMVAPVTLQTICIRHEPKGMSEEEIDQHTLKWVDEINKSGQAFMSPSKLDDHWMVRVSVGVESTEHHHVEKLWGIIQSTANNCL